MNKNASHLITHPKQEEYLHAFYRQTPARNPFKNFLFQLEKRQLVSSKYSSNTRKQTYGKALQATLLLFRLTSQ